MGGPAVERRPSRRRTEPERSRAESRSRRPPRRRLSVDAVRRTPSVASPPYAAGRGRPLVDHVGDGAAAPSVVGRAVGRSSVEPSVARRRSRSRSRSRRPPRPARRAVRRRRRSPPREPVGAAASVDVRRRSPARHRRRSQRRSRPRPPPARRRCRRRRPRRHSTEVEYRVDRESLKALIDANRRRERIESARGADGGDGQ